MGAAARLTRPRVVFDTNVLVSALLFRTGSLGWLVDAWQTDRVRPLGSKATVAELLRVFAYPKFRLATGSRQVLVEEYLPWCEAVVVPVATDVPDCRDPDDRMFLELTAAANADALVTGDGDLLALQARFATPILTPATLKARLA